MKQSYFLVIFCKNNTTNKKNGNLWRGLTIRQLNTKTLKVATNDGPRQSRKVVGLFRGNINTN